MLQMVEIKVPQELRMPLLYGLVLLLHLLKPKNGMVMRGMQLLIYQTVDMEGLVLVVKTQR